MTTKAIQRSIYSLCLLLLLPGCGIIGLCGNECPKDSHHIGFDCGCTPDSAKTQQPGSDRPAYYVTRRYVCRDRSNPTIRPECDITDYGDSCQTALSYSRSHNDPCPSMCNSQVRDNDRYWNGTEATYVQGGPCQGWSHNRDGRKFSVNGHTLQAVLDQLDGKISIEPGASIEGSPEALPVATETATNSPGECLKQCSAGESTCLPLVINSKEKEGLLQLKSSIPKAQGAISAPELQKMFGETSDPCERGETRFENGKVSNSGGSACRLATHIPNSIVTIGIPKLLEGNWTVTATGSRAAFDNSATRPSLEFSHVRLQRSWGGDIVGAFSEGNYLYFSVGTRKCIRAKLQ